MFKQIIDAYRRVLNLDASGVLKKPSAAQQRLRYHGKGMPHEPMSRGRCHAEGRPSKLGGL